MLSPMTETKPVSAAAQDFRRDIQQRIDRRPGRRLRPELQDIFRRWEAGPHEFRSRFEVEWQGKNLSAIDVQRWISPDSCRLWLMDQAATVRRYPSLYSQYFQRQPDLCDADPLSDLARIVRIMVPSDAPEQDLSVRPSV
jgi:hypothetical protein